MIGPLAGRHSTLIDRATTALTIAVLRSGAIVAKFGITLFIARLLDLEALGLYGLVAGAAVVVPVVAGLGTIEVLCRESVGQRPEEVTAALVPYWTFMAVLYLGGAAACLPWAYVGGQVPLLLLIAILLFVEHVNADALVILNHRRRPRLANLLFAIRTAVWIAGYIGLALAVPSLRTLSAVLVFWLVGAGMALLCFVYACRDWPWRAALGLRRGMAKLRTLVRASRTLYLNSLANTGGQYIDRYLVGAFLGLEPAGVYFLFWSFANALSNLVNTSLLQVQSPAIILSRPRPDRQKRLLGRLRIEAAAVCVALASFTAGLASLALAFFPDPRFGGQASVLLVLLAGFVLRMAYEVEGIGFYARHDDRRTLHSALIVFAVSLSITAALTPALGLMGPALAVLVSYLVGGLWRWRRNRVAFRSNRRGAARNGTPAMADDDAPIDVALFMPTLIGGGAERVQLVLAEYFLSRGLRVDVIVCKRVGALRDSVPAGARLVDLGAKRVLMSLGRYERYLLSARPRVVVSSVENASLIACLARARGVQPHRLIVRQDNALIATRTVWGEPRRWAWLLALAILYRFADHVIAVSRGVEGELRRLLRHSGPPVSCVRNPVIAREPGSRIGAQPNLPWTRVEGPLIAAAGRLHPIKDYPTLLRAFALLRRSMPMRLVVMGEGPARPELEALSTDLGIAQDVLFAGFLGDPLPVIRAADVFVLSSRSEGLANVLVEALAAGTPVVSTDCPHGPREILQDGRYGRLVPVGDADALAAAIGDTLTARRPGLPAGLKAHLAQFSVEQVGRTYLSMFAGTEVSRNAVTMAGPPLRQP